MSIKRRRTVVNFLYILLFFIILGSFCIVLYLYAETEETPYDDLIEL